jgi:hypothetical protein
MRRCPSRNGRSVGDERWSNTSVTAMRGGGTEVPLHSAGGGRGRRGEEEGGQWQEAHHNFNIDLQDLAQPLHKVSASPLATYVMISWQVRAFSQAPCPTTTWAATIFDMYESAIDMQVKQQKLTQGVMSSVLPQKHAFGGARWCKAKTWEVLCQKFRVSQRKAAFITLKVPVQPPGA